MLKAQEAKGDIFHVFAFKWKPGTRQKDIERARLEILAFQGVVPGLLETHVGPNLSKRGLGYTFVGVMRFDNQVSLDAYPRHQAHEALLTWLVPLIDAIELDLKA